MVGSMFKSWTIAKENRDTKKVAVKISKLCNRIECTSKRNDRDLFSQAYDQVDFIVEVRLSLQVTINL